MRVHGEDGSSAHGASPLLAVVGGGLVLDLLDEIANPLLVGLGLEMSPAGEWREVEVERFFEVDGTNLVSSLLEAPGLVEGGAVDPDSR